MVNIAPEQIVYNKLYDLCVGLGYDVYESVPMHEVKYPFVALGVQMSQNIRDNKEDYDKNTQVQIHVFHDSWMRRGTLTTMMHGIERAIVREFGIRGEDITQQIMGDPTNADIIHGILEPNIQKIKER